MIADNLAVPFETDVLGVRVAVEDIELSTGECDIDRAAPEAWNRILDAVAQAGGVHKAPQFKFGTCVTSRMPTHLRRYLRR